jgi:hypothetical protein
VIPWDKYETLQFGPIQIKRPNEKRLHIENSKKKALKNQQNKNNKNLKNQK